MPPPLVATECSQAIPSGATASALDSYAATAVLSSWIGMTETSTRAFSGLPPSQRPSCEAVAAERDS